MSKIGFLLFAVCFLANAENVKLYMRDGSYQLVTEYKVESDRVRFYSIDREDWEEVPTSLVDLNKTKAEIKAHADEIHAEAAAEDEEKKAERTARKEVASVPSDPGVYLIEEQESGPAKLTPLKIGESKVVNDKRRSILKTISPVPLVPGKATLELEGPHSSQGTANRSPEFYIRLSDEERFGIAADGRAQRQSGSGEADHPAGGQRNHAGAGYGGGISSAGGRRAIQNLAAKTARSRRVRGGAIFHGEGRYAGVGLLHRAGHGQVVDRPGDFQGTKRRHECRRGTLKRAPHVARTLHLDAFLGSYRAARAALVPAASRLAIKCVCLYFRARSSAVSPSLVRTSARAPDFSSRSIMAESPKSMEAA